jgi:hypothetical protein
MIEASRAALPPLGKLGFGVGANKGEMGEKVKHFLDEKEKEKSSRTHRQSRGMSWPTPADCSMNPA